MSVFFSDLDSTLIWSRRKAPGVPKRAAEYLNGKEQSFMTEETFRFLRDAGWLTLVPVTTRSEEQYRRIFLMESLPVRYALVCNGGKLLDGGREDAEWTAETLKAAARETAALREASELLREYAGENGLHRPEPYLCYIRTEDPEAVLAGLEGRTDPDLVQTARDARKVYLIARSVTKGGAVRRFAHRFGADRTAAAGDGALDLSMLREADYPLAPESLAGEPGLPDGAVLLGGVFSDRICGALAGLHREGKL